MLLERRLWIEAVDLRHATVHVEEDHARCPARMVQARQDTGRTHPDVIAGQQRRVASQQRRRRHGPKAATARAEHLPAGQSRGLATTAVV